jgi:hypothetical protein
MNGKTWQYSGYVESINIKGQSTSGNQFLFSVVTQDGDTHNSFTLDASEPSRYAAMASLLTAAFAGGKMVYLNTTPTGGVPYASEIVVIRGQ